MTEIIENLYIGNQWEAWGGQGSILCYRAAAKNTFYLKNVGVTHVLNTAEGQQSGTVDTNEKFYK